MKTNKQKILSDIKEGKLINASNIKTDLRTNKDMKTKYNNLLKMNQRMRIILDKYQEYTGIGWEEMYEIQR